MVEGGTPNSSLTMRLIGPVEVRVGANRIDLVGVKQRALVAMLALDAGQVVSVDRLIDGIWGDAPPPSVRASLQVHVSQVRRLLDAHGAGEVLATRRPGYQLSIAVEHVDALRCRAVLRDARSLLDAGRSGDAAALVASALPSASSASSVPLDGLERAPFVVGARAALLGERLDLAEVGFTAALATGRHDHVVGELEHWVAAHPYRERLWELLAIALYRCGRQTDSLERIVELRRLLRSDLGLEVSPTVARLELAILSHDSSLDLAATALRQRRGGTNLRRSITALFGIAEHLTSLQALVADHRLVTLIGPGGIGKTTLAVEFAWTCLDRHADGVWMLDLAPIADPSGVARALSALWPFIPHTDLGDVLGATIEWLGERSMLLVIDNCEHVIDAVGPVVAEIVARCGGVRVVATSREPLGVVGEFLVPVPPLEPATDGVALFRDRARAVSVRSSATDDAAVSQICERLDGLPLAIELAAARTIAMSPREVLDGLNDRFRLLRGRGRVERHQTLEATVEWSYQLLTPWERQLFDRWSVFAGGADVIGARRVAFPDDLEDAQAGLAREGTVIDAVESLVAKSMLVASAGPGGTRYHQLESLRQFGAERLEVSGAAGATKDRHLAHVGAVVADAQRRANGPAQRSGHAIFAAEWDNIRVAHQWAVTTGDAAAAVALLQCSYAYAHIHLVTEFGDWAERTRALDLTAEQAAYVHGIVGEWAHNEGHDRRGIELALSGVRRAPTPVHPATKRCWWLLTFDGAEGGPTPEDAFRQLRSVVANAADLEVDWMAMVDLVDASLRLDPAQCPGDLDRLRELAAKVDAPALWIYSALFDGHGRLLLVPPDFDAAEHDYARALELALEFDDLRSEGMARRGLALSAAGRGDTDALERCRRAIVVLHESRFWQKLWQVLDSTVVALIAADRRIDAAVLLGHLEAHVPSVGMERTVGFRAEAHADLVRHPDLHVAMQEGAALGRDELVGIVLTAVSATGPVLDRAVTASGRAGGTDPPASR